MPPTPPRPPICRLIALVLALLLAGAPGAQAQVQALDPAGLIGVWRGVERTGDLVIAGELILHPGGVYQRAFAMGQLRSFQSGRWEVAGNWLHFAPTDYEPKVYLGIPQAPPPSETWAVRRFDGRSIEATVGVTTVHYQRVP